MRAASFLRHPYPRRFFGEQRATPKASFEALQATAKPFRRAQPGAYDDDSDDSRQDYGKRPKLQQLQYNNILLCVHSLVEPAAHQIRGKADSNQSTTRVQLAMFASFVTSRETTSSKSLVLFVTKAALGRCPSM